MKNVVILISGHGTNMRALVQACKAERWPARIAAVIANRATAAGLSWAAEAGIATRVIDEREHASRESADTALAAAIDDFAPDLVALAGFMRILTNGFVAHYAGRMLNVHPSLLPMLQGLATHRRALEAGLAVHGATVHFVTPDLDQGPIVAQAAVPVLADDDAASLGARVLAAEHIIYPRAVRWFVDGRLTLVDGRAHLQPADLRCHFSAVPA
ncbi:MAG: phosphoribosylglycinamide formyltransferase [Janthinobacterium lividum]